MDVLDNSPSNSFFIDKLRESGIGKASSLNNPRKRKRPEMPVSTTLDRPGKKAGTRRAVPGGKICWYKIILILPHLLWISYEFTYTCIYLSKKKYAYKMINIQFKVSLKVELQRLESTPSNYRYFHLFKNCFVFLAMLTTFYSNILFIAPLFENDCISLSHTNT